MKMVLRRVYTDSEVLNVIQALALLAVEIPNPQRRAGYEQCLRAIMLALGLTDWQRTAERSLIP